MTGTLVQNGLSICDGKIEILKCSQCYLRAKKLNSLQAFLLSIVSYAVKIVGLDPTKLANRFGTGLGSSNLVTKKKSDLIKLVDSCDKIIILTNWYKEILISNGISQHKIELIKQGLPTKKETITIDHNYKGTVKFIFVGRISYFKGLHILVEAFQQLEENTAKLDIYGQADDVDYESNLKKLTLNVPFIQWKGILPQENVVQLMAQYNALCLCSTFSEMSPLVIQEAFASGIPVIASNVYGNTEQIKHGVNGLLFNFNDPADLLKQLQRCIDEKDLLFNLSKNILQPRSFEEVANDHIKLYKSLLS
jgi:glycosyltransferase involved in cell wall biosynthesis